MNIYMTHIHLHAVQGESLHAELKKTALTGGQIYCLCIQLGCSRDQCAEDHHLIFHDTNRARTRYRVAEYRYMIHLEVSKKNHTHRRKELNHLSRYRRASYTEQHKGTMVHGTNIMIMTDCTGTVLIASLRRKMPPNLYNGEVPDGHNANRLPLHATTHQNDYGRVV